jgi:hypothetical protein
LALLHNIFTIKPEYNILRIADTCYGYTHNEVGLIKLRKRFMKQEMLNKMRTRIQLEDTKIRISKALGVTIIVIGIDKYRIVFYLYKSQAAKVIGV